MPSLHEPSEEGLQLAYDLARQKLAGIDLQEVCRRSGAKAMDQDHLALRFLNRPYRVTLSTGNISLQDEEEEVPLKEGILILHYLTRAEGIPFTDQLITYGQLQGGKFYCPVFIKRTVEPLLKCFGNKPERLLEVAQKFGARPASHGDLSVAIDAFPLVRIVIVLWRGDDEVPSNGNILFDKNISHSLSSEDVTVLTETLIWKLIRLATKS